MLGDEGPSISVPFLRDGTAAFGFMLDQDFNRSAPLAAIRAAAPEATVRFRDGRYASEAALAAQQADVAIVFTTQYQTEGFDVPAGQEALAKRAARACPERVISVVEE